MKLLRIGLPGPMLMLANFAGILGGFMVFKTFDFEHMLIRPPVAAAISILFFVVWSFLLRVLGGHRFLMLDLKERLFVFFAVIALNLMVIVPLYYFTRNHYNPLEQVVFPVLCPLPVNLIALCGVWIIQN
jgi:hypothetical protein